MIRKGTYNIRCRDGLKLVDGYIYTTSVQGEPISFGITQYNDGWYIITELSTGMRLPFETNINLTMAVKQLKVFLTMHGLKKSLKRNLIKYGRANEVRMYE